MRHTCATGVFARILCLCFALSLGGCFLIDLLRSPPSAIVVPAHPRTFPLPRTRVVSGLHNPRGMLYDGGLLVALAGTGEGKSGSIVRLDSRTRERTTILADLPSANALEIVRRDEVFGAAAIARGDNTILSTVAFFGGPTEIIEITGPTTKPWATVDGNLNSLAYDPSRNTWFAASSTSDTIVEITRGIGALASFPLAKLDQGQDPVPGYLRYDGGSEALLVSLFSGSTVGEEHGNGTELVQRAGRIVRLDPDTGETLNVIDGLTTPTDFEIDECGRIFVLEFCDAFIDPVPDRNRLADAGHGGFRRFSGRLLLIDRHYRSVRVVADGLDTPTNLLRHQGHLYIAGGMGTPGRTIPGASGPTPLIGYIDRIDLGNSGCE